MYETKSDKIGNKNYCIYCGKEVQWEVGFRINGEIHGAFYCECNGAKLQYEFKEKSKKYTKKLDKLIQENKSKLNDIKYNYELTKLNEKYNK